MKAYCPCFCTDTFCFRGVVAACLAMWGTIASAQTIIDDSGSARNGRVGYWSSIVAQAGEIAVSYYCADDHAAAMPDIYALRFAWWDGLAWQRVTVSPDAGSHTSMRRDRGGMYHIVYDAWCGIGIASGSGSVWSRTAVDTAPEIAPTQMSMELDSLGHPHIAYMNLIPGGDRSIRYTHWDGVRWARGATEIVRTAVWTPTIGFSNSWLKLDRADIPHIAFADPIDTVDARGPIRYATLQNGTWGLESVGIEGVDPSLAIGSDGMPRMLFNSDLGITYAYKDAGGWHVEAVLAGESGDAIALALSRSDQPFVTFGRTRQDHQYLARREATGWVVTRFDGDGTNFEGVTIGGYGGAIDVDELGRPHASYLTLDASGSVSRSNLIYAGPAAAQSQCIRITQHPQPVTICRGQGTEFDAAGESNLPLAYAWEWRESGSSVWVRIAEGVNGPTEMGEGFHATGASGTTLTLAAGSIAIEDTAAFRCVLTSSCGRMFTDWVELRNVACCPGDFNHDGTLNFFDYLDFADAFAAGLPAADFNANGVIDFFDYLDFADAFSAGC